MLTLSLTAAPLGVEGSATSTVRLSKDKNGGYRDCVMIAATEEPSGESRINWEIPVSSERIDGF